MRASFLLKVKERFLNAEAAGIASERAIRGDHAMTGHDDGKGVLAIRGSYGSAGTFLVQRLCNFFIRPCSAIRDFGELFPDPLLKFGSTGI